jgi:hypothetical protein
LSDGGESDRAEENKGGRTEAHGRVFSPIFR